MIGHTAIGALGDSFYEYLIKSWLQSGKKDKMAKKMYDEAVQVRVHCLEKWMEFRFYWCQRLFFYLNLHSQVCLTVI